MGAINANALLSVNTRNSHNFNPDGLIESNGSRMFYKSARNELNTAKYMAQITQPSAEEYARIKALKEDIIYFQRMIEKMAQQDSEKMDFHMSLVKSCNSIFGNNYHSMHKKYIDLLNKTQAIEAEIHLRALEGELAMLISQQESEVEMEASFIS